MKVKCRGCETFHNVVIGSPNKDDFSKLRSFLGEYLGKGFKKENMDDMQVARLENYNGKIIGCVQIVSLPKPAGYLARLKIDRAFRRQGIAEELMRKTLGIMRPFGYTNVYAVTLKKGPGLLVEKLGAKEITRSQLAIHVPEPLLTDYDGNFKYWFIPNNKDRAV